MFTAALYFFHFFIIDFSAYEKFETSSLSSVIILILMILSTTASLALLSNRVHKAIRIWAACSSFLTAVFMFTGIVIDILSLMYFYNRLNSDLRRQNYGILCLCFLFWPLVFLLQLASLWYSFAALQVFRSTFRPKIQYSHT